MTRKKIILGLLGIIALIILFLIYNFSFITLQAQGDGQGNYTYQLTKTGSGKTKTVTSSRANIKVLVGRGNYQILMSRDNKTFFSQVRADGWLGSSSLGGSLSPENSRSFAGYNPAGCFGAAGDVVISYTCGGDFTSIKAHEPASSGTPTFVKTNTSSPVFGTIVGSAPFNNNLYFLVKTTSDGFYGQSQYQLIGLDHNLNPINTRTLTSLSVKTDYHLSSYAGGFLLYSDDFSSLYSLQKPSANLSRVQLRPAGSDFAPLSLSASGGNILTLYGDKSGSEIVGQNYSYKIKRVYKSAWSCAKNTVCLLDKGGLFDVYSVDSPKLKKLYSLSDIKQATSYNGRMLLATPSAIINFDAAARKGYAAYSLGVYKFCGLSVEGETLICLNGPDKNKFLLSLDLSQSDTSAIDKKIAELEKSPLINSISVYGNYIFITPKLGQLSYQPSLGEYGYDPAIVSQVDQQLKNKISGLNIDQSTYKVKIVD